MNVLEGIEARLAAATRGSWRYIDGCILSADGAIVAQTWSKSEEDFPNHKANGELMAAAPADLALLASAVRAIEPALVEIVNWYKPDYEDWDPAMDQEFSEELPRVNALRYALAPLLAEEVES